MLCYLLLALPQPTHITIELESQTDMLEREDETRSLPESTLPDIQIRLRGFPNEEEARTAGGTVGSVLHALGSYYNLERLDGVTIAYDFDAALAELDRGFDQREVLTRTDDDLGVGVAMTPAVIRNGQVRAHMVLHASIATLLEKENEPHRRLSLYILAHEAAHAHDLACLDRAMPGVILRQRLSHELGILFHIADACWSEYAACRRSAFFCPEQTSVLEDTFCHAISGARKRGNEYIRNYRYHGRTDRLLSELVGEYGNLARYAAYLLGHIRGIGAQFSEAAPRAHEQIEQSAYFTRVFSLMSGALEEMWANRESWSGFSAYDPLISFARELLGVAGIGLKTLTNGSLYLDVPWRVETLP